MSILHRIAPGTMVKPDRIPEELLKKVREIESRRPKVGKKEQITLRIDPDVMASYRALGAGWQAAMNEDLRKARKL